MFPVYDIVLHLALVAALPYFLVRGLRDPRFLRGWRERLGRLPAATNPHGMTGIWIQAVSVGEVLLARTLMNAIRDSRPDVRFYLSTTTITGRGMAENLPARRADALLFFPLDLPWALRRTLDRLRPALFVAMETEIWPNLLRSLARREIPAIIVNGRISPEAYPRYRRGRFFFRRVLRFLDLALMQTQDDAARLISLGMPKERVQVTGNLKFDTARPEPEDTSLPETLGIAPDEMVFIAGSTLAGEEEAALEAFEAASKGCARPLLILAPRHPPRFDDVARLLERRGVPWVRRSLLPGASRPDRRVILLDSLGELAPLYSRGRVIFVGGSLVPRGGHNILEPAARARPVIFGPHMENFREMADSMIRGGGGFQVSTTAELGEMMSKLAQDEVLFRRSGEAARAVVESNRGALERTLKHLDPYLRRFARASC